MIKFNVTNSLNDVMFTTEVSNKYVTVLARVLKPYIADVVKVKPGTGNAGKNMEYKETEKGLHMSYTEFTNLMDSVFI